MDKKWDKERIKNVSIAPRIGTYEGIPATPEEEQAKKIHLEIFKFSAISIGDEAGQAFFVPLDESDRETAEYIIRAIKAYDGE